MMLDQLNERLESLPPGAVAVLTRAEFDAAFRALPSLPDKKKAAITFGDWCRCGVIFIGTDKTYVSFARRGGRPEATVRDAVAST